VTSLSDYFAEYPVETHDQPDLDRLLKMAERSIETYTQVDDVNRRAEAAQVKKLISAEIARRRKLDAEAPSFAVGDTVYIAKDLTAWNEAMSAKPTVGMIGTVVKLDAYDAKHLPKGKVPVRLSMADLGYEVDEDDEDSTHHVFYIHAWALEAIGSV